MDRVVLIEAANELLGVHDWLGTLEEEAAEAAKGDGGRGWVEVDLRSLRAMSRAAGRAHDLIFEALEGPAADAPGRPGWCTYRPGAVPSAAGEAPEQGLLFPPEARP